VALNIPRDLALGVVEAWVVAIAPVKTRAATNTRTMCFIMGFPLKKVLD